MATSVRGDLDGLPSFQELPLKDHLGLAESQHVRIGGRGLGVWVGWEQGHPGMEPEVGEKRGEGGGRMLGVVVAKFRQGQNVSLVGLLVVAVDSEVLLQHRIHPLRLPIRLGMEGRCPVGPDPQ